ncbi:MAG TPA: hypothetical protein DD412_03830 [Holosporales bacterium]|nr:hypothetical protein [Holosporales bacterium]
MLRKMKLLSIAMTKLVIITSAANSSVVDIVDEHIPRIKTTPKHVKTQAQKIYCDLERSHDQMLEHENQMLEYEKFLKEQGHYIPEDSLLENKSFCLRGKWRKDAQKYLQKQEREFHQKLIDAGLNSNMRKKVRDILKEKNYKEVCVAYIEAYQNKMADLISRQKVESRKFLELRSELAEILFNARFLEVDGLKPLKLNIKSSLAEGHVSALVAIDDFDNALFDIKDVYRSLELLLDQEPSHKYIHRMRKFLQKPTGDLFD